MSYNDLIKHIVDTAEDMIGAVAVRKAAEIDGITAVDGELTFETDLGEHELEQVIQIYSDIIGKAVNSIIRHALENYDNDLPDDFSKEQFMQ